MTVFQLLKHSAKHGTTDEGLFRSREAAEHEVRMELDEHLIEFKEVAVGRWEYEHFTIVERSVQE